MTTEEFEGHLMAVLHGPNAEKIAERVFVVALANKDIATILGAAVAEAVSEATAGMEESIFELAVLAHLSEVKPKRGDIMKWAALRVDAIQRMRARLAASLRKHPEAERIANEVMLDLDIKAGGD
jgi:hypothetical protein